MYIDRDKLAEELVLREHIQKLIKKYAVKWIREEFPDHYQQHLDEQKLRGVVRNLLPHLLLEELSNQEMEKLALSFVSKTLADHLKTILDECKYLEHKELQNGFIKRIYVSLVNDYEENRAALGEEEEGQEPEEPEQKDDTEGLGIKVYGPSDFADDEPTILESEIADGRDEAEDGPSSPWRPGPSLWGTDPEDVGANLTDNEKMGWDHAGNTWPKVTKQIKKLHKIILNNLGTAQEKVVDLYEEWLYKNFEAHCKNVMTEESVDDPEENIEV